MATRTIIRECRCPVCERHVNPDKPGLCAACQPYYPNKA
jgi:hypothetical protein